jgi:hypothetical protein
MALGLSENETKIAGQLTIVLSAVFCVATIAVSIQSVVERPLPVESEGPGLDLAGVEEINPTRLVDLFLNRGTNIPDRCPAVQ